MNWNLKRACCTAALVAVPCAALANVTDTIVAGGGAIIPSLGVTVDLYGKSSVQDHTEIAHSLDMGFSYAHAKHKQTHDLGDGAINFGGQSFTGQQDIDWTSNIQLAHIAYRPRIWFGQSNFAIEPLLGIGWAGLGIKGVGANGQAASERLSNGGVVIGVGGLWRFASATSLQVRVLNFISDRKEGVTGASRFDITVAHEVTKNVQLRGGLGVITATSSREDADSGILKSPIHTGGAGLLLGVDLLF